LTPRFKGVIVSFQRKEQRWLRLKLGKMNLSRKLYVGFAGLCAKRGHWRRLKGTNITRSQAKERRGKEKDRC